MISETTRLNLGARPLSLRSIAVANIVLLVASWGPSPILSSVVATVDFVTLPLLLGFAIRSAYALVRRRTRELELNLRTALVGWILGIIVITASASFTSIFFAPKAFEVAALFGVVGLSYMVIRGGQVRTKALAVTARSLILVGLLLVGSVAPFWYLRRLAPFPFMVGADFLSHLVSIDSTLTGASGIHLRDDGFITMVASSSLLAHSQPLWTLWVAPVLLYLAFAVGIYLLARTVIRNVWVCLASALLPLWFMGDGLVNDLIFFLRPNIIMCMIPFALVVATRASDRDGEIKLTPIAISALSAVLYFMDDSTTVYDTFTSHLPSALGYLIQPGYVVTAPGYSLGIPSTVMQDFYATFVSSILFLIALRTSDYYERRLLVFWYLVTCAAVLIESRVGLLLSLLVLGVYVLRRYSGSRLPPILSMLGIGVIVVLLTGQEMPYLVFQAALRPLAYAIPGVSENLLGGLNGRIAFLGQDYDNFFLYLFLVSLASLSIVVLWRYRSTRPVIYASIFGLFMYFTPFPDSHFFLILVTPMIGITIALALLRLESFVDWLGARKTRNRPSSSTEFLEALKTRRTANLSKGLFVVLICIIFMIAISNITQVYDSNISTYKSAFGSSGVLSSFSAQDLSVAEWLKSTSPQTTLIVSDPTTVLTLAALSGLPYTVEGQRITYGGTTAQNNVTLFRSIVGNLSAASLASLVAYYRDTDKQLGLNSSSHLRIVLVVNNRTTWWVYGSEYYYLADAFKPFPALAVYSRSPFVTSVFNASESYRVYVLSLRAAESCLSLCSVPDASGHRWGHTMNQPVSSQSQT